MTVSSISSRVVYEGDGTTSSFGFAFYLNDQADLVVTYTDSSGNQTVITSGQYSISAPAVPAPGWPSGGTVTWNGPSSVPIGTGTTLTLERIITPTQPTAISNQGAFWPQVIERALDRLTTILQGYIDKANRSLRIPSADTLTLAELPAASLRANQILGFDGSGQPQAVTLTTSIVPVGSWVASFFLPQSTRAGALGALGAAGTADNNIFTGTNSFTGSTVTVATQAAGDSSTKPASTAFVGTALTTAIGAMILRNYLAGLVLSNNSGTPNSKLDVAAGVCADDVNAVMLATAGGTIDCTTTGANGLDTGSLAISTWYHVYIIGKTDGTRALLASTSASSPTMPSGYTLKRRLGSFKTDGSSHILGFTQTGDRFDWSTVVTSGTLSPASTTAQTPTLAGVPAGVTTEAILSGEIGDGTSGAVYGYVSSMAQTDVAAAAGNQTAHSWTTAGVGTFQGLRVMTDTSQRVRYRMSTATSTIVINQHGWLDRRGR